MRLTDRNVRSGGLNENFEIEDVDAILPQPFGVTTAVSHCALRFENRFQGKDTIGLFAKLRKEREAVVRIITLMQSVRHLGAFATLT